MNSNPNLFPYTDFMRNGTGVSRLTNYTGIVIDLIDLGIFRACFILASTQQ
jgi:hypothetical protein